MLVVSKPKNHRGERATQVYPRVTRLGTRRFPELLHCTYFRALRRALSELAPLSFSTPDHTCPLLQLVTTGRHHAGFHRFFSLARWDPNDLWKALLRLLLPLLPTDIEVIVDDTLCVRKGPRNFWHGNALRRRVLFLRRRWLKGTPQPFMWALVGHPRRSPASTLGIRVGSRSRYSPSFIAHLSDALPRTTAGAVRSRVSSSNCCSLVAGWTYRSSHWRP